MLNELLSLTESWEFEEYGTIKVIAVWKKATVLTLVLDVEIRSDTETHDLWELDCVDVFEHQASLGHGDGIELFHDHPLLWPYVYPRVTLSFYGEATDYRAVLGALYETHHRLVDNWIPFSRFMNGDCVGIIRGRYGMLADGPKPLVKAYGEVLTSFKIDCRVTEGRPAYYTNDEFSGLFEVGVVVLRKNSYVVARSFEARRLNAGESVPLI